MLMSLPAYFIMEQSTGKAVLFVKYCFTRVRLESAIRYTLAVMDCA